VDRAKRYLKSHITAEIQPLAIHFDRVVHWKPLPDDSRFLIDAIEAKTKIDASSIEEVGGSERERRSPSLFVLNANINFDMNIEGTLNELRAGVARSSRVVLVVYNSYFKIIYRTLNMLGIRRGPEPSTFITEADLKNLATLSGFEVVRFRNSAYFPFRLFGVGDVLNSVLPVIPVLRWFGLASVVVLRPVAPETGLPSLTIVIPARNERGNIENAIKQMPYLSGAKLEIIFVEGHSSDNTWEEILRVQNAYSDRYEIKAYQQTGKGKVDAVRLGFSKATSDLLTILDADLTMPPERLESFYEAYRRGHADLINGSRLVYPMESQAMRFLNKLGNVFFAKALSYVMGVRIGDSLCGTKLLSRRDYRKFEVWREHFGDFDPFGDFELLFPAAELGLGIVDIPVRYRDRIYGSTNINRFRNGWELLRMTCIGFFRMKLGKTPKRAQGDAAGLSTKKIQTVDGN
jgi:glycosyltransferase involved in cell wall biosynthesis